MPTVIVLDTSLAMGVPAEAGSAPTKLELVIQGLGTFLDYIGSRQRLEYVALITFSNKYEVICPFTRDLNFIKEKLSQLTISNATSTIGRALLAVDELFTAEWDLATNCNVVLITHENVIIPPNYQFQIRFPTNIILICISNIFPVEALSDLTQPAFSHIKCKLYHPESPLISHSFHFMFFKICEEHFSPWIGMLSCGNLNAKVVLSPNPGSVTKVTDFDQNVYTMDPIIEICGFIEMQYIGSPGCVSRHLVLPFSSSMTALPSPVNLSKVDPLRSQMFLPGSVLPLGAPFLGGKEIKMEEEDHSGEGLVPNFCVLLHGALKVGNMAALCYVGREWYGFLYSWADSKKKSNLMLSLLHPGSDVVPWLGDLNNLTIASTPEEVNLCEKFPVKPLSKRIALPNPSSWIRVSGLQSDIQKVLRHAKKLPEKTQQFFKELNRVKKAALSIGFYQLLSGLAAILERECTLLPGTAHPACALQLTHAATLLKEPCSMDVRYTMMPMKVSF